MARLLCGHHCQIRQRTRCNRASNRRKEIEGTPDKPVQQMAAAPGIDRPHPLGGRQGRKTCRNGNRFILPVDGGYLTYLIL
jgi:hypothetical protein